MKKILATVLFLVMTAVALSGCLLDSSEASNGKAAIAKQEAKKVEALKVEEKREVKQPTLAEQYKMDADFILIKKSEFKLYAVDAKGNIVAEYGCALGLKPGQKEKSGDMKTPDGVFPIDEILDASYWTHDFNDGKGEISGAYGPWFISLDTTELSGGRWSGIGIHGTHAPESIGTRASEGCIRLNNADIIKLKQFARVGMKVIIEE